jgi:hypothetical protein
MKIHPSQPAAQIAGPHRAQATGRRAFTAGMAAEDFMQEAAAALWATFDDAYSRASARTAQDGTPPHCTMVVPTPSERRYLRTESDGEQRSIIVSLMLSVVEGRVRGGALISTSRPYLSLFVAPVTRRDRIDWRVGTSGHLLTAGLVDDLFLSVLDDDADATRRLAPFITYSLG